MAGKRSKSKARRKKPFPIWGWVVIAGLVTVGAVVAFTQLGGKSYPAEISVAQAAQKRDQGAFILDVREPSEWEAFHIPGATLIPLGELASRVSEVTADQEVVVVCRSGNRSQEGRDILKEAGFKQVTSMTGGVTEWQKLGFPIITEP
jgi:rhodanese-related sulfurtransferase